MQLFELVEPRRCTGFQLRLRADHVEVPARARIERQRQPEVALARDVPVAHVAQPVVHALAVERGRPLDGGVRLEQLRPQLFDRDEPVVDEEEDQRRLAAPAVRVTMDVRLGVLEQPALAQVADDLVGRLDGRRAVQPAVLGQEAAALVDRRQDGQVVHLRQLEVLGAGARRDVDDAGPFLERYLVPRDHAVHDPLRGLKVVVRPFVFEPDQLGAANAFEELAVGEALDRHPLAGVLLAVLRVGIDRCRHVRRQRPRRRRPHDERLAVAPLQGEADEERRVRLVAVDVRLRELVLRDGRAAARTPLRRAVALVQGAALVQRLEEAPDVLDVRVAEGVVVVAPVHPLAEPDRLTRDHPGRLRDELAAAPRELVEPVLLDLPLGVEAQIPLDLDLDPEPLAVETVLVALVEPLQRLVALEQVLVRATPEMVDAEAVGRVRGLRPVEEAPVRPAPVTLSEPLEDPLLLPPGEHLLLEGGVIRILRERLEHPADCRRGTFEGSKALVSGYDRRIR